MSAAKYNSVIEQGATWLKALTLKTNDINGVAQPMNLTGYTARMQIKSSYDSAALEELTSENTKILMGGFPATTFTGSCAAGVLTVTSVTGTLAVRQVLYRTDGSPFATIDSLGTGVGGTGTYNISYTGTIASESMTSSRGNIGLSLSAASTTAMTFAGCKDGRVLENGVAYTGPMAIYDLEIVTGTTVRRVISGSIVLSKEVTK